MRESITDLTIRTSQPSDDPALRRLAVLDSCPRVEPGPYLIAEHDGTPVAALPLAGGRTVADPFKPTADIVALLQVRARQLRAASGTTSRALSIRGACQGVRPMRSRAIAPNLRGVITDRRNRMS
jgi:hypothetical protein